MQIVLLISLLTDLTEIVRDIFIYLLMEYSWCLALKSLSVTGGHDNFQWVPEEIVMQQLYPSRHNGILCKTTSEAFINTWYSAWADGEKNQKDRDLNFYSYYRFTIPIGCFILLLKLFELKIFLKKALTYLSISVFANKNWLKRSG